MIESKRQISADQSRMFARDHFRPCSLFVRKGLENGAMLIPRNGQQVGCLRSYYRAGSSERNQLNPVDGPAQHRAFGEIDQRGVKGEVQVRISEDRIDGGLFLRCEQERLGDPLDVAV